MSRKNTSLYDIIMCNLASLNAGNIQDRLHSHNNDGEMKIYGAVSSRRENLAYEDNTNDPFAP